MVSDRAAADKVKEHRRILDIGLEERRRLQAERVAAHREAEREAWRTRQRALASPTESERPGSVGSTGAGSGAGSGSGLGSERGETEQEEVVEMEEEEEEEQEQEEEEEEEEIAPQMRSPELVVDDQGPRRTGNRRTLLQAFTDNRRVSVGGESMYDGAL